ncbi:MAG: penicillin-binding protein activator LpoB [Candidatus Omnitrophica bacterium]|nr:penicillin-binding protein activator LpoB [Candidatus Omnitrophota bacterium]
MKKIMCAAIMFGVLASGCASEMTIPSRTTRVMPDEEDRLGGTGIESTDVLAASRKMAESILNVPEIVKAQGLPRIAVLAVRNSSRFVIDQDIFTTKIRAELNKNARDKVRFLARERIDDILKEREAKRQGLVTASKEADLLGVDFYLTGEIKGIAKATMGSRSDYILMVFQLIDTETSDIVWEDSYEVKRVGIAGVAYQ